MSAIDDKYFALGGPGGFLGNPIDEELAFGNGVHVRNFMNGFIAWSPGTGAFEVHGAIGQKWIQFDPQWKVLGLPVTDELGTPDGHGRYNHFERGSIYWTPETGAHEVHGAIRDKWGSLGWERGQLRYPISDEKSTSDGHGRFSQFQGGTIFWTPEGGAVVRLGQRLDDN